MDDKDNTSSHTNSEVKRRRRKEREIYVSHAYIYEPLQSKILVHIEK